jgi:hypothetical protein
MDGQLETCELTLKLENGTPAALLGFVFYAGIVQTEER